MPSPQMRAELGGAVTMVLHGMPWCYETMKLPRTVYGHILALCYASRTCSWAYFCLRSDQRLVFTGVGKMLRLGVVGSGNDSKLVTIDDQLGERAYPNASWGRIAEELDVEIPPLAADWGVPVGAKCRLPTPTTVTFTRVGHDPTKFQADAEELKDGPCWTTFLSPRDDRMDHSKSYVSPIASLYSHFFNNDTVDKPVHEGEPMSSYQNITRTADDLKVGDIIKRLNAEIISLHRNEETIEIESFGEESETIATVQTEVVALVRQRGEYKSEVKTVEMEPHAYVDVLVKLEGDD